MASINSLGAGSGVLTSDLVDKIIVAERKATDLRLETKKAQANAKLSAVGSVRSAIARVESAVTALRDPGAFGATSASVSDTKVASVTTNSTAEVGTHTIEVQSLAKSQTLRSRTFSSLTDTVGTGTLSFRFGTTTLTGGGAYDDFVVDAEHPGGSVVINTTNNTLQHHDPSMSPGPGGAVRRKSLVRGIRVKMRGLPYTATVSEIQEFFGGLDLVPGSVQIGTNREGRPSGEAWVEFVDMRAAQSAVQMRNKQHLGARYIELFLQS